MTKKYEYRAIIGVGDTNLFQHADFSVYFNLQSIVRGLWVKDAVQNGMESLMNDYFLITKSAQCEFIKDFRLFDEVLVTMQVKNIKHVSADIIFYYYNANTMELHAKGYQKIVFADRLCNKLCTIPANFKAAGLQYHADENNSSK